MCKSVFGFRRRTRWLEVKEVTLLGIKRMFLKNDLHKLEEKNTRKSEDDVGER